MNYQRIHHWRLKYLPTRTYTLILASVIGCFSGLAAVLLKTSVHHLYTFLSTGWEIKHEHIIYTVFPLIGIILTVVIVKKFLKVNLGHGIPSIIYAVSKKSSRLRPLMMYSRMVTSFITVGFGGSVGLEAPIVVTGSAIGSNVASFLHLDYKKRTILLSCGAAGALAAIFNAPIAGVLFALEVILIEFNIASFIPLLIASASGTIVSKILLGEDVMFAYELKDKFLFSDILWFVCLGFITGLVSVFFARINHGVDKLFWKFENPFMKAMTGGIILGIIILFFPPIFGEGYSSIKNLLAGNANEIINNSFFQSFNQNKSYILLFAFLLVFIKMFASSLTIAVGGSGGLFAPALFVGGVTGFCFSNAINQLRMFKLLSESNFVLVGMCGLMSGMLSAPLTGIFFIAEITGGYELFIPLMIVSSLSYMTFTYFETHSIYTKQLVMSGNLYIGDKDKQVLSQIDMDKLIEKDLKTVTKDMTIEEMTQIISSSKRNIFPVVDEDEKLLGILLLDDVREIMFDEENRKNVKVLEVMHDPPAIVDLHDPVDLVMTKFESTNAWNLPVTNNLKYVGILSKAAIFSSYRNTLKRI